MINIYHPLKPTDQALRTHSRGITLIIVMIFLVSLSLIGAAAMRNVSGGERVVANERDRALSFQGAESAGRESISLIQQIKAGSATTPSTGYYATPLPQGGNAEFWRTTSSLPVDTSVCASTDTTKRFNWSGCSSTAGNAYGNINTPRYVIERLPDVVKSATVTETWYRVTTRASGGSNEADVVLQIVYTPP
jgi:type IV pilus assembly protein PilX